MLKVLENVWFLQGKVDGQLSSLFARVELFKGEKSTLQAASDARWEGACIGREQATMELEDSRSTYHELMAMSGLPMRYSGSPTPR